MRNTLMIKAATLAATVAMTTTVSGVMSSAQAATISSTVNGVNYNITTVKGTFDSLQSTLESQPWWGSTTLAGQFASAADNSLGLPNFGILGPFFAYGSGYTTQYEDNFTYNRVQYLSNGYGILDDIAVNDYSFTYATATPATPVPTPALLPGLLCLGASVWRKRKSNLAASIEA